MNTPLIWCICARKFKNVKKGFQIYYKKQFR